MVTGSACDRPQWERMSDPALGSPRPRHARSDARRATRERRVAIVLVVGAFVFAVCAQSLWFSFSTNMHGDIEYHRGVAFTMISGRLAGQGPIFGVVSYFGGLYPMALGFGSRALGVSFDGLLSVVSWPMTLVLPLALLALGRALWPGRTLEPALLVFIGTIGSSLGRTDSAEWVFSALPSGANEWPVYPRDIALLLLIFGIAIVLRGTSIRRLIAAGVVCALAVATQAQVGAYATGVVAVFAVLRGREDRTFGRSVLGAGVVGISAIVVSAWWWIPRAIAADESRRFLLASYPGLRAPDSSLSGIVNALGVTGVLAALGAVLLIRSRARHPSWFGWWLAAFVPLALAGRLLGDSGLLTERRIWFFAAVPLVVCAAGFTARLLRLLPLVPTAMVLAALLVVPSIVEVVHTRDLVATAWRPEPRSSAFAATRWDTTLSSLQARTQAAGGMVVLAPDVDALYVWQHSGAQPFSLWLTGPTKLGFDPARLTDWSMPERLRLQNRAFRRGLPGLCDLARRVDVRDLVLRHRGRLLGTHDLRPSSVYRVPPEERSKKTVRRGIAPHEAYYDSNSTEFLGVTPPLRLPLGFSGAGIRAVEVDTYLPVDVTPFDLVLPTGTVLTPRRSGDGTRFVFSMPHGVPGGTRLRVLTNTTLLRTIGFVPSRRSLPSGDGTVDLSVASTCPGGASG